MTDSGDEGRNENAYANTAHEERRSNYVTDRRDLLKTAGVGVIGITSLRQTTSRVSADHTQIEDWGDLAGIGLNEESSVLVADLDSDTRGYDLHVGDPAGGWEPIDGSDSNESWTLDGNGYSIKDLVIDRPDEDSVGLFGDVTNGRIENLSIREADITGGESVGTFIGSGWGCTIINSDATGSVSGDGSVGGIIGYGVAGEISDSSSEQSIISRSSAGGLVGASDSIRIVDSSAAGSVSGGESVGGLVGSSGHGEILNSFATGSVDGGNNVGGLVGVDVADQITDTYATGTVEGESNVGGLLGQGESTQVNQSYATGAVTGKSKVGGLAGWIWDGGRGSITESFATGSVKGESSVGGLAGDLQNSGVSKSYAKGSVKGGSGVGGLVGVGYGVAESYATGAVSGDSTVGGAIGGYVRNSSSVYWDVPATGQEESSGGGTGFGNLSEEPPADEMTGEDAEENMDGFDFEETWQRVTSPDDYPVLRWQRPDSDLNESIEIDQTRTETQLNSPVTVQVLEPEPTDGNYTYHWEILDKPTGSNPGLLHGDGDHAEVDGRDDTGTKPHAALRPDTDGSYKLRVELKKDGTVVGEETTTIEANEQELSQLGDDDTPTSIDGIETAAELAKAYAPTYHFHPDEWYYPTRFEAFVENAELRIPEGEPIDEPTLLELGDENLTEAYNVTDEANELFLKGTEADFQAYQRAYPPTIYANVTGTTYDGTDYVAVTYWAFYLFDPKTVKKNAYEDLTDGVSDALKSLSAHASDTETVTILFDESGPQWLAASQHYSGEYLRWEKVIEQSKEDTDAFDVYPAKFAHSSFLINTSAYKSTIPIQERWFPDWARALITGVRNVLSSVSLATAPLVYRNVIEGDVTGDDPGWPWTDFERDRSYDLVILSDSQGQDWREFAGIFRSDEGEEVAEDGQFPHQRGDRWENPGEWFPNRMLPEPEVLNVSELHSDVPYISGEAYFVKDDQDDMPAKYRIRKFTNPGVKPHTFVVDATLTVRAKDPGASTSSTTADNQVPLPPKFEPLGWDEKTTIDIPLGNGEVGSDEELLVDVDIQTYPEEVSTDERDTVDTYSDSTDAIFPNISISLPTLSFGLNSHTSDRKELDVTYLSGDTAGDTTERDHQAGKYTIPNQRTDVSPGEDIESAVSVTNDENTALTLLVTMMIDHTDRPVLVGEPVDVQEITLEPDETGDVSLSWTVTEEIPEGTYDILTEVWVETDPEELTTQLGSQRAADAFTVQKPRGTLQVTASPEKATIIIGGEIAGATPLTTDLPVGTYDVTAIHESYEPLSKEVSIDDGKTTTVSFSLHDTENGSTPANGVDENGSGETVDTTIPGEEESVSDENTEESDDLPSWLPVAGGAAALTGGGVAAYRYLIGEEDSE